MNLFLSGIVLATFLSSGLYFFLFWKESRDRFFLLFAASCWMLALERIPLPFVDPADEFSAYIYLIRLSAFVLLLVAIVVKNWSARHFSH